MTYGTSHSNRLRSDKQASFLLSLLADRAYPLSPSDVAEMSSASASFHIDKLFKAPKKLATATATATVPDGNYAIRSEGTVKFYNVWNGSYGVSLKVYASDDKWPVKGAAKNTILAAISVDVRGAAALYGTELGKCCRCNRTLTDEQSRELGIGPECRKKG